MAYKTLAFVALSLALVHTAHGAPIEPEEPCLCPADDKKVWEFLQSLSIDVPEAEKEYYAVAPGELSPMVTCDCESDRRKRKVLESDDSPVEPVEPVELAKEVPEESPDTLDQKVRSKKSLERGSCPDGQVKFGIVCVDEDSLDYK